MKKKAISLFLASCIVGVHLLGQKVLIVSPNCSSCKALKERLANKGLLDKYVVVDVSTSEGMKFARKLGVKAVPECAVVDEKKKIVRVCSDDEWDSVLK